MINSLVCVPSPFKEKPPPNPLRRRGSRSLSPNHPSRSPRYRGAEISQGEGSKMQIDLEN
ncbi:hypothetical protein HMPREF9944_00092 [Segatella maculosa OT 289]|uniref:Uncharacterized protein n=1 Tax=Segatella maculosa OT 289 TaxID=999422 RepID=H1HIU8_9BACT|nr:hypothetical protein HMPREF9944_00092 [Segatella maculosa OT 289]